MLNNIDNYIFDLDGTIINSSEEVLLCFKKAFEKANYKIDEKRLNSNVIGPPLKEIVETIAPDLKDEHIINNVIDNYQQIYDYDKNDISVLYDGMYDYLTELKNQGKKLFLATFKPQIPTYRILKQFKLDIFDDVYAIDKFGTHITKTEMISDILNRYNLDKTKTVMIGDAASDMISANKNGVKSIGVLWGYGEDKTELIKNATYTIQNLAELKFSNTKIN